MYELVNTSLPNGLIAGTHGFATVAMTKGVPDILRGRLEALCAYTHQVSTHDATYYQQNPVNWFHVVLPQGEHVVGRVAPSDFDYTGRTNRLARLRVFGASEMPGVGGAEILANESRWFCQPWEGEPRYLDDDKNTCGRLRFLRPSEGSSARAWEAVFGDKGSRYAQQVAWQIEKNLSAGGKPVYFKTSAAWDVSGEKLLQLFAEVINLLPLEMRASVTFSTYPVSLPGGTGCSLRGVYDRDKIFDVSSATQAWVDCENAKIVHSELLPTSGPAGIVGATARSGNRPVAAGSPSGVHSTPKITIQRVPAASGDPNSYRNLIASRKQGPDMFVVGIVGACLFVLLAAGTFFFWMMQRNKRQMQDSGAAAAVEAQIESLESEQEQQERIANEKLEAQRKEAIERAEKASAEKENVADAAKTLQEAAGEKPDKEKTEDQKNNVSAAENAGKNADSKEHIVIPYLDAEEFRRGKPSTEYDSRVHKFKEPFMREDGCCVYFYSGDVVTNAPAGLQEMRYTNTGRLLWGEELGKSPNVIPGGTCGFVIWYNPKSKRVYIDRDIDKLQNKDGERWFADPYRKVDLAKMVFGPEPHFEELWTKYRESIGKETRYLINWKSDENSHWMEPISTEKAIVDADYLAGEIQKPKIQEFDAKINAEDAKVKMYEKELECEKSNLEKLQGETNVAWKVKCAYEKKAGEIANMEKQNPKMNEERKKRKEEIDAAKKKKEAILYEGTDKPTYKEVKPADRKYTSISDLKSKIEKKEHDIKIQQDAIKDKNTKLGKAKSELSDHIEQRDKSLKQIRDNVCKMMFTVCLEDEASEGRQ